MIPCSKELTVTFFKYLGKSPWERQGYENLICKKSGGEKWRTTQLTHCNAGSWQKWRTSATLRVYTTFSCKIKSNYVFILKYYIIFITLYKILFYFSVTKSTQCKKAHIRRAQLKKCRKQQLRQQNLSLSQISCFVSYRKKNKSWNILKTNCRWEGKEGLFLYIFD